MRLPLPQSLLDTFGIKPMPLFMLSSWIKAAAKCGFNAQPLFQQAGIKVDLMHLDETRVSPLLMISLLEQSVSMSSEKYFPLVLGDTFAFESLPEFETLLTTSATLRDAIAAADMARRIVLPWVAIDLVESGEQATIRLRLDVPIPNLDAFGLPLHMVTEAVLASICKFGRNLQGEDDGLVGVHLKSGPGRFAAQFEAFFGVPVAFNQADNALIVERRILDRPLEGAFADLNQQAHAMASQRLGKENRRQGIAAEIEAIILASPDMLSVGMEDMAQRLGLHSRTLQRRLKEDGDGYLSVQARVRHQLACQWLRLPDHSIDDISARLGFSDRRAFTAAFKRWEGTTPKAWRERHLA